MTYLIDPSIFYWMSVVDGITTLFGILLILSIAVLVVIVLFILVNLEYGLGDQKKQTLKRIAKIALPTFFVSAAAMVFIPSTQSLLEMQIAKMATVENAEWTVESLKAAADYIVQALQKLK